MTTYYDLLADARRDPFEADFHTLRMAYTRCEDYAPYVHDNDAVQALGLALRQGDFAAALEAVTRLLDQCYLDIEAHMAADFIYTRMDEAMRSAHHRTFAQGLIRAILATGNGQSFETAFIVISVPEEYTVLRILGLRHTRQTLVNQGGHWFDVLDVVNPATGESGKVYFNIDLPKTWLDRNLSASLGHEE